MTTALAASRLVMGQESLLGEGDELAAAAGAASTKTAKSRSLDDVIVDAWEGLVRGTSQCPLCGGRLEAEFGAHTRPVGARCPDCGSTLH